MKLLVVTQKVDSNDPILGFFHRWLQTFAGHFECVTVIGQLVGVHALPGNVTVLSMGKEQGRSRVAQIFAFYVAAWKQRRGYDAVFVHMTPIWVVLGWPLWLVFHKPVYLWYEARGGGWALPAALRFVRKSFGATPYGLPRTSSRHEVVGHGIDTDAFVPAPDKREPGLIITIGRVTPVKHYDAVLRAFSALSGDSRLRIAGGTITERDEEERARLDRLIAELGIADRVIIDWIAPFQVPALLQRADLMLHACSGGLDKVVLEAMACGCPVVSSSEAAGHVLPNLCLAPKDGLAEHALRILALSPEERSRLSTDLRTRVTESHSLERLSSCLASAMR